MSHVNITPPRPRAAPVVALCLAGLGVGGIVAVGMAADDSPAAGNSAAVAEIDCDSATVEWGMLGPATMTLNGETTEVAASGSRTITFAGGRGGTITASFDISSPRDGKPEASATASSVEQCDTDTTSPATTEPAATTTEGTTSSTASTSTTTPPPATSTSPTTVAPEASSTAPTTAASSVPSSTESTIVTDTAVSSNPPHGSPAPTTSPATSSSVCRLVDGDAVYVTPFVAWVQHLDQLCTLPATGSSTTVVLLWLAAGGAAIGALMVLAARRRT